MESPILPEELGGLATQLLRCILPDGKTLGLGTAGIIFGIIGL